MPAEHPAPTPTPLAHRAGAPRMRSVAGALALALLAALAGGCAPAQVPPSASAPVPAQPPALGTPSAAASSSAPASSTPTSSATPLPADLDHLEVLLAKRWSGLSQPTFLTNAGDGTHRIFILEQSGTVRVVRDGKLLSAPYLDIRALVLDQGERGLLGMAFAPDFAHNGHLYIDYVDTGGDTVIARYIADDPAADRPHFRVQRLLHISQPYPNHKGGCLLFGPDGDLWIGMGDGGSAGDPGNRAQNPRVLLGKILRLDVEGPRAGATYAIPAGQPAKTGWAPEVWSIGMRNPWRFSFDASTGALWIADVGQDAWEEVDVLARDRVRPGLDFGWPLWEASHPYRSNPSRDSFVFPIYEYPHPFGESISGGYVYRGRKYPALVGTYLFGDYVKGWLGAIRTTAPDGTPLAKPQGRKLMDVSGNPSSFGVDEDGELYLVDYTGSIWAVTATSR